MKKSLSSQSNQITQKATDVQQAVYNWKNFAIFFGTGLCFILLSFSFLPIIAIMPAKFGGLFSLGSLSIIISLYIIKGGKNFMIMFFNKSKIGFSIAYIVTLIGTIHFSIIDKRYLYVLIFSILQMIALAWLFASSFPAGLTGMKFITKQIMKMTKSILSLIFKPSQPASFLPI